MRDGLEGLGCMLSVALVALLAFSGFPFRPIEDIINDLTGKRK